MKNKHMIWNGNELVFSDSPSLGIAGIAPGVSDDLGREIAERWNKGITDPKPVGMYGETPRVRIGKFTISRQDDDSVWIETDQGEGAQFPDNLFEQCVLKFYEKNF